ncbi:MAG TPA: VWA domain-containing protein [Phycisphaerae bacterium]|nr:VWA domain-containing protein [Phycisphaerae bacterium]
MKTPFFTRISLVAMVVLLPSVTAWANFDDETESPPKPPRLKPGQLTEQQKIDQIANYLIESFADEMKSKDWVVSALGTVSLAQIDHPLATAKLVEMLEIVPRGIGRVYVWEALNARASCLDKDQFEKWHLAGLDLSKAREFRGHLRSGLMTLAGATGATDDNVIFFNQLMTTTDIANPVDHSTLKAMRQAVTNWQDSKLILRLIGMMANPKHVYKIEYLLSGLKSNIPPCPVGRNGVKIWQKSKIKWMDWLEKADLKKVTKYKLPYIGGSDLIGPPEKIEPASPKWRRKLELPRLKLDHLDVSLVVDSTGSMSPVVNWLRSDLHKMLDALRLISKEPRLGLVFYRDQDDQYLTTGVPLTGYNKALQQAVHKVKAAGGGDYPEAVFEALCDSINNQKWSRSPGAKKVIVLIGDAPPHADTLEKIELMVKAAVKNGFRFYCVKATTYNKTLLKNSDKLKNIEGDKILLDFDDIATWGNGKSIWGQYLFRSRYIPSERDFENIKWRHRPNCQIVSEMVKGVLAKEYHSRAQPFVNILMEYVEQR